MPVNIVTNVTACLARFCDDGLWHVVLPSDDSVPGKQALDIFPADRGLPITGAAGMYVREFEQLG